MIELRRYFSFFFFDIAKNLGRSDNAKRRKKKGMALWCRGYTVKNVHVFVPVFLYAVTMLIFQIKRIISSEKWLNYVVTSVFFFLKLGSVVRTTLKGENKGDGLIMSGVFSDNFVLESV